MRGMRPDGIGRGAACHPASRGDGWQAAGVPPLDHRTWPELVGRSPLLVVPLGSTEQHGPHLPLGTDSLVAAALAHRLDDALAGTGIDGVVTSPFPFGSAGEHDGFPGTLSVGQEVVELALVELVRSAGWAAGVVLVNGHGGNTAPVRRAVDLLTAEGRAVLAWFPPGDGADAHAGRTETSLLLALAPELVRLDLAEAGNTASLRDLLPSLREGGVRAVSPNGVLGDPGGASAAEGRRLLEAWSGDLVQVVLAWRERMPA
jgi:mycofactocin system creatininase family protein